MRRNDVASTSFRRRVPTRFLINQCQIITFLILKYDIIENSRIELRGIVLPVQVGGLLGGGPKAMLAPLSNYWGGLAPRGPPSSYAYDQAFCVLEITFHKSRGAILFYALTIIGPELLSMLVEGICPPALSDNPRALSGQTTV